MTTIFGLTELATVQNGFGNMSANRSIHPGDASVERKKGDEREVEKLDTMKRIDAFRATLPRTSVEEILSARHEGHKY